MIRFTLFLIAFSTVFLRPALADPFGNRNFEPTPGATQTQTDGMFQFQSSGSLIMLSPLLPDDGVSSREKLQNAIDGMTSDTVTFYANGYYTDIEPHEYNVVPDCSRSRPNGKPLCEVYEIRNSKIRFRDEDGEWDDWMDFKLTRKGFEVDGDEQYNPIASMDGMRIGGVYTGSDAYSGPGFSAIGPSAGTISYSDTGYVFLENGLFQWRSEKSSHTSISTATPWASLTAV